MIADDVLLQAVSIIVAVATFTVTWVVSKARDRKVDNREIYQNLEFASIDLFRFEADHPEVIRPVWEPGCSLPPKGKAEYIGVMNYVCQMLNLFEMAIRFRKEKVVPPEVFGSWVIWYFELAGAPQFPLIWEDVSWNYTSDLRNIMNKGVQLTASEPDENARRIRFFAYVSELVGCRMINKWCGLVEQEKMSLPVNKQT